MSWKVLHHPTMKDPPTWSRAVEVTGSRRILISGCAPLDDNGPVCIGDARGQTEFVMNKIKAILEANGASLDNIFFLTTYVTDIKYREVAYEVKDSFFKGKPKPGGAFAVITELGEPEFLVE